MMFFGVLGESVNKRDVVSVYLLICNVIVIDVFRFFGVDW